MEGFGEGLEEVGGEPKVLEGGGKEGVGEGGEVTGNQAEVRGVG